MKNENIKYISIGIIILAIDLISKYYANSHFKISRNTGFSFSLFNTLPPFIIILISLVFLIIVILLTLNLLKTTKYSSQAKYSLSLIIAGSLGNLIERLFHDYVTDFISILFWSPFNIADIAIVLGIASLVIILFKDKS